MMMFFIVLLGLLLFRWFLLMPLLGTKGMLLFDAILFTVLAAMNLSDPSPIPWLGYALGCLCVFFAFDSGKKYLKYDETQKAENEQEKSDADV